MTSDAGNCLLQSVKRTAYKNNALTRRALVLRSFRLPDTRQLGAQPPQKADRSIHNPLSIASPPRLCLQKAAVFLKPSSPHPSEARKITAKTGQALEIRLFRATLSHLRPGPDMEPAHDAGGDPSNPSWYLPRGRKGWRSVCSESKP